MEKRVQGAGNTNCASLAYTGALQASLKYDPTGRLFEVSGGTLGTQRFAYDGNAMIGEYNAAGTLLRRYVHGSNVDADDPLIVYEGAAVSDATRRYLHADPRGSIVAVTNYQGTSIATNSYDEFGIPDSASGNDIATKGRFRYTGQAWLPELGMYYYKARIYSPTLGRFLQTDPIGYEDQFNLYAYVGNDPINGVDPTGESCVSNEDQKGVTCQIDNPGDLSGKELDAANDAYTRATNRLLLDPDRKVSLEATRDDGLTFSEETTAGEIAQGLIDAEVSYGGDNPGINASTSRDGKEITLFKSGVSRGEDALSETIIHEGGHTTKANRELVQNYERVQVNLGNGARYRSFNSAHQRSFKSVARRLFNITVP